MNTNISSTPIPNASLHSISQKEASSEQANEKRLFLIKQYTEGNDFALDRLLLLNKYTQEQGIPMTQKQKEFLQAQLEDIKSRAAYARERVPFEPEKLDAINLKEKRFDTIYRVAIDQSVQKP
jgi:hypothetical protein